MIEFADATEVDNSWMVKGKWGVVPAGFFGFEDCGKCDVEQ